MNPAGTHFFLFEFFCLKAVTKGSCGPVKPEHFKVIFLTVFSSLYHLEIVIIDEEYLQKICILTWNDALLDRFFLLRIIDVT